MQSVYDDVVAALAGHTFTIPNVTVRKPYDATDKTYPFIVVHEIVNLPRPVSTVNGETRTALSYQLDILTRDCLDDEGTPLSAFDAGRRLLSEVNDVLDGLKVTRRTARATPSPATDVVEHIWRGDCVQETSGYTYRP